MSEVAKIADRHEVTMAIEPELGNVVNSAIKARMLLDEVGSPWIKVVIDPANLFHPGDLPRMKEILDEAFEWLGPDIVLAHAKELGPDGRAGGLAPGQGRPGLGPLPGLVEGDRVRRPPDRPRAARVGGCQWTRVSPLQAGELRGRELISCHSSTVMG